MEDQSVYKETKGKALIVDDAPDTRGIIRKLLIYEGYEVITASTGEEGVEKTEAEKPDVILMDINLPGIDGSEALRRIREINPIQCVIMLTAYATLDNAIQALKEGASDFVKKPFENEHLVHVVNQTLEKYLTLKEKEKLEEEVRRLSITDDLTGLYNHRYFFKTLESELVRRKRQKTSLSLIMFDLDNFKRYNDRYGGDEFAALLIGATRDQALHIAERIRSTIEEAGFEKITVSIGLAEFKEHMDMEGFVKSADDAMYLAKHSGGNRVQTSTR